MRWHKMNRGGGHGLSAELGCARQRHASCAPRIHSRRRRASPQSGPREGSRVTFSGVVLMLAPNSPAAAGLSHLRPRCETSRTIAVSQA